MRTQKEIINRIKERLKEDILGFEWNEYLPALTKESAESLKGDLIKPDADLTDWPNAYDSDEAVYTRMKDCMSFAWDKALNERGISATRSIMHYMAWLWLVGEDDFDDLMDNYCSYGKPQLKRICEFLGIDYKQYL